MQAKILRPDLEIKRADRDDMTIVQSMIRSSADWYKEIVDRKDLNQHYVDDAWAEKNFAKREFFIGYSSNEPFGTLSFQKLRNQVAYLGYIYLDLKFVGKGLGSKLMEFAMQRAKREQLKEVALIAHPKAHWAVRAYEKFGFRKVTAVKEKVLAWNDGALAPYYEEGFALYLKPVNNASRLEKIPVACAN